MLQRSIGCFSGQDEALMSTWDSLACPAKWCSLKCHIIDKSFIDSLNLFSQDVIMDLVSVPVHNPVIIKSNLQLL